MAETLRTTESPPRTDVLRLAAFVVIAGTTVLLPLLVDRSGEDVFRLPKELIFRAGAIAMAVVFAFLLTGRERLRIHAATLRRPEVAIAIAAVAWTAATALTSTRRPNSAESLVTVVCSALLFVGMLFVFRDEGAAALDFVFAPAVVNAIIVMLQEYGVWQPFQFPNEARGHMSSSALIGNPNDVGTFLLLPALAAAIAATVATRWRRAIYSVIALVLLAGIAASATRTAIVAYVVAIAAFVVFRSRRNVLILFVLVAIIVGVAAMPDTRLGRSVAAWRQALHNRDYDVLLSNRLPPFIAAVQMWRDHPLTGVGPGCFRYHYMEYRLALQGRYPRRWLAAWPEMFGETHNDHLQLLAEAGIPAYAIFLAALGAIALPAIPFTRAGRESRKSFAHDFAREFRVPLAGAVLVLTLAQFPLQIAAPRLMILYFSALCFAWDRHEP